MSKGYLLESDVENLALDTLRQVGFNVYKSPSPTIPNPEIDAMRNNDHSVPLLTDNVEKTLRKLNPGYSTANHAVPAPLTSWQLRAEHKAQAPAHSAALEQN